MKKAEIDRRLLDLKERQDASEKMLCPRCGWNTIKAPLTHNALSRHADLYLCDECGMTEAMLDMMRNPLPLEQWAFLTENEAQLDLEALSMKELVNEVMGHQVSELNRLHAAWVHRKGDEQFETYRGQALKACPGLLNLWDKPFSAVYQARDGQVLIRFRWNEGRSEHAIDYLHNAKK